MGNIVKTCLLIYTFIFFNTTRCCSCKASNSANHLITVKCKPSERAALLNFKHNLTYFDKEVSSSWESEECCEWRRVSCDNTTGHILKLDLNGVDNNHLLKMEKLESLAYLLELKQLERLDLSYNNFSYSSIPSLMGLMKQLRHLNFSSSSLSGLVPCQLGQIPTGNQLQALSDQASVYAGNPYLCAEFLSKKYRSKVNKQDKGTSNEGKGRNKEILEKMGSDLVVMSGFATGFWGVVGCLVLNRRWRHAFFRRLEDGYNWLYVRVALRLRAAKSKINKR
ncbi:uncharacterized protein LOC141608842 [Silene latifolia]|uniref:uncharacterized protein LOC141608842 n=1 Tax=Silene latifolia TaxID=37657 RepID=UPI003D76EED8